MKWKDRKVFVTGAGGFIGSHLTEFLLEKGASVRALAHYNSRNHWGFLDGYSKKKPKNLEVILGDVRDPFFIQKSVKGCDIVFHLAALIPIPYSYIAPQTYVETNINGTLNVLEASRHWGVKRLIHTSTSETYGTAEYVPINEKHPLKAQSPYAASKIGADKLVESYHRSFNIPAVTVRPFNTFGPRQSLRAVIPTILSSMISGEKKLPLGNVSPVRDFTFVKDTVRGFICAAESSVVGEVINIGMKHGWTIRDVVKLAAKELAVPVPKIMADKQRIRPSKSEVHRLICDNRKAKKLLNWNPRYSFKEGLKATAEYIRHNMSSYKTDIYNV